jgi:hypothetical protein
LQYDPSSITERALTANNGQMLRNMMQYTVDFFLFGYYNLDTSENKNPYGIQDLSGFTAGSDAYKAWKEHNDNI